MLAELTGAGDHIAICELIGILTQTPDATQAALGQPASIADGMAQALAKQSDDEDGRAMQVSLDLINKWSGGKLGQRAEGNSLVLLQPALVGTPSCDKAVDALLSSLKNQCFLPELMADVVEARNMAHADSRHAGDEVIDLTPEHKLGFLRKF